MTSKVIKSPFLHTAIRGYIARQWFNTSILQLINKVFLLVHIHKLHTIK